MLRRLMFSLGVCCAVGAGQSDNGIWVDQPKVYDDYYLQLQLNALKARLQALNGLDQATLQGHVGGVQGATSSQWGVSVQGAGPGTAQTSILAPPTNLPAGVTATGPYGTSTAYPSLTPSPSASPVAAPADSSTASSATATATATSSPTEASALPFPTTLTTSAVDTLREQMQLSSQITDFALLLDGALDDRFSRGKQTPKRHVTLGFNITIQIPVELRNAVRDSVAEVEMTFSNPPSVANQEPPSIMTLLPREKTYNVAGMTQHSLSLGGGGILAGVVNLGASWGFVKQKAYLYEEQDTLALQRGPNTFVWQFRPVLEQRFVEAGTRQNFVQVAMAIPEGGQCDLSGDVTITTRWRKIDKKTGVPGAVLGEHVRTDKRSISFFDITPASERVDVFDIGNGNVLVRILGHFLTDGLSVRIGDSIRNQGKSHLLVSDNSITFTAAAEDIVSGGAYLIGRDGQENQIVDGESRAVLPPCGGQSSAAAASSASADGTTGFQASVKSIEAYSATQSVVTVEFRNPPALPAPDVSPAPNPLVVTIGNQLFGLSDKPFLKYNVAADGKSGSFSFVAPSDLLNEEPGLTVRRLLGGVGTRAMSSIPRNLRPEQDLAISGVSIMSDADPLLYVLLTGRGLQHATVLNSAMAPPPAAKPPRATQVASAPAVQSQCVAVAEAGHETYLIVTVLKSCLGQTKEFLLGSGANLPVVVTMPQGTPSDTPKAPIDPATVSIAHGAKNVTVEGPGLDQIDSIRFGRVDLPFVLAVNKTSLTIRLLPEISSVEGVRFLDVVTTTGQKLRITLVVKKGRG